MGIFRTVLEKKLRFDSRLVLRKYKPDIIGVTGSVGKTSTKEAIYTVLSFRHRVGKNLKNYNNELGVPLSILQSESGYRNLFSWIKIFLRVIRLLLVTDRSYPNMLVLEMGADKPGDIDYLLDLASCSVGVVTAVGYAHVEFFGSMEKIIREKQKIVSRLGNDGFAVLNADDDAVFAMRERTKAKVLTFGFSERADVKALEPAIVKGPPESQWVHFSIQGMSFKVSYAGSTVPFFLPSVFGNQQVYSALAAICVGIRYGMNLVEMSEALRTYIAPPGRMKLLPGIKHTFLLDDTYNSSPQACFAAFDVIKKIEIPGKKYAALGDMAELGPYTQKAHEDVGRACPSVFDYLVTVGEQAKMIADAAIKAGMKEDDVYSFGKTDEAGKFIQERIEKGDFIFVKGSQVARMERIVKELMAEPERAVELLVRQGQEWE